MFDSELTCHLAALSKLTLTDEELNNMTADMTGIIALMDKVCEFNPNIQPYTLDEVNYENLRTDNHVPSAKQELILKNAPKVKNNSFIVPKVV